MRPVDGKGGEGSRALDRAWLNQVSRCEDDLADDGAADRLAAAPGGATKLDQIADQRTTSTDRGDFAAVYESLRTAIYSYVRRMMTNEADAEDLTVAAFEKALRAWERRPPGDEIRPWLFRIATNACLDELRRRQRVQWQPWNAFISLFHPSQVAPDNPEEETLRRESAGLIRAALGNLSPRDRAALILRECQGLPVEDVARTLGISRGAAKIALFRARERLRTAYVQLGGELPKDYWTTRSQGPGGTATKLTNDRWTAKSAPDGDELSKARDPHE